jgi:hypothetical protein
VAADAAASSPRAICLATSEALSMHLSCTVIKKMPQLSMINIAPAARVATASSAVTIPRALAFDRIHVRHMIVTLPWRGSARTCLLPLK